MTPPSRIVWTNDEGDEGGAVTTVTFEEKGDQTLLVIHGALAARPVPAKSCRALRDQYVSLLQPESCAADSDCVAVTNLMLPGVTAPCGIDVNLTGGRALSALASSWTATCAPSSDTQYCGAPQPAVCRNGLCAEACPGEQIPICPRYCIQGQGVPGSACDADCLRSDGLVCGCTDDKVTCGLPPPTSATCPVTCTDYSGGGTYAGGMITHPTLDGGVPPDAANGGAGGSASGAANGGAGGGGGGAPGG